MNKVLETLDIRPKPQKARTVDEIVQPYIDALDYITDITVDEDYKEKIKTLSFLVTNNEYVATCLAMLDLQRKAEATLNGDSVLNKPRPSVL